MKNGYILYDGSWIIGVLFLLVRFGRDALLWLFIGLTFIIAIVAIILLLIFLLQMLTLVSQIPVVTINLLLELMILRLELLRGTLRVYFRNLSR